MNHGERSCSNASPEMKQKKIRFSRLTPFFSIKFLPLLLSSSPPSLLSIRRSANACQLWGGAGGRCSGYFWHDSKAGAASIACKCRHGRWLGCCGNLSVLCQDFGVLTTKVPPTPHLCTSKSQPPRAQTAKLQKVVCSIHVLYRIHVLGDVGRCLASHRKTALFHICVFALRQPPRVIHKQKK